MNSSSDAGLSNSSTSSSSSGNDRTIKIALDIGHQRGEAGGVEFLDPYKATYKDEYDYWSKNIHKIYKKLEGLTNGCPADDPPSYGLPSGNPRMEIKIFDRSDYGNSLSAEVTAIEQWGPDIAVSMHLNAFGKTYSNPHGAEVLVWHTNNDAKLLGDQIRYYLSSCAYLSDRGNKPISSRGVDGGPWCSIPGATVLVEAGFVTNGHDCDILVNKTDFVTDSIALGIYHFMNIKGWIYIS